MLIVLMKLISLVQIIGGVIGCVMTALSAMRNISAPPVFIVHIVYILLYTAAVFAGVLLWKKDAKGRSISMAIQAIQIPYISIPALYYKFVCGTGVVLGLQGQELTYKLFSGSYWSLSIPNRDVPAEIAINIVAVVLFIFLFSMGRSYTTKQ